MLQQVARTIARFQMISPGQRVAVACSGGPDSTALLLVLHRLATQLGCTISVCHYNHHLRGEDAAMDEQFVRELADRLQLPAHVEHGDVQSLARQSRTNLESKARELRYRFFRSLLETGAADRVAVGHTADDQAETVLHRLLRGAGTRGLAGIYPVVEGRIIRPLLEVRRASILHWLTEQQQPWREDASNLDLRRTRNRIRHRLMPLLAEFNPQIVRTLAATAEIARQEEGFWADLLKPLLSQAVVVRGTKACVNIDALRGMHPAVARRVVRSAIAQAAGAPQAPGAPASARPTDAADFEHVQQLLHLAFQGQSGASLSLPGSLVAKKEFSHLIIEALKSAQPLPGFEHHFQVPARIRESSIGSTFSFEIVPMETAQARYNQNGVVLIDPCLVAGLALTLRNWRPGDAYIPQGHQTERKLKELFQRKRIAQSERRVWPVLLAGGKIIWTREMGVAAAFAPQPGSRQALVMTELRGGGKS